jgi:hypothetical protein
MLSADQVPIKLPHLTMLRPKWVVLIAGPTGSALRAVRPPNLHITPGPARFRLSRKRDGFLVSLAPGHHGPDHPRDFVGKRDSRNLWARIALITEVCWRMNRWRARSPNIHGTDVPVEEPSTASTADIAQGSRTSVCSHVRARSFIPGRLHASPLGISKQLLADMGQENS